MQQVTVINGNRSSGKQRCLPSCEKRVKRNLQRFVSQSSFPVVVGGIHAHRLFQAFLQRHVKDVVHRIKVSRSDIHVLKTASILKQRHIVTSCVGKQKAQ